jgi:hypothetical protein
VDAYVDGRTVGHGSDPQTERSYFLSALREKSTMNLALSPGEGFSNPWPDSAMLCSVHPTVIQALKNADCRYFKKLYPHMSISWQFLENEVWHNNMEVPSLFALCLRRNSMYHWAVGKTNGRLHVIAEMANLYLDNKLAKAVLVNSRPVIDESQIAPLKYVDQAMDHMYRLMRIDMTKKESVPFSFKVLEGMYLGASAGHTRNSNYEIKSSPQMPHPVQVSGKGKKAEHFDQYLNQVLDFLRTGKEPPIDWTMPPKNQNSFTYDKQHDDVSWYNAGMKCRVFNIPSGVYIIMERLVSTFRHLKERGWAIRVGHKWGHGGADTLAKCLGITKTTAWVKQLVEGDIKNFDASVLESFINLYFSTMTVHMDTTHEDFSLFEKIIKYLLAQMLRRFTRVFGDIWAFVSGGVPSGAYNTSHMDSWIMLLYFCLFCVYTIMTTEDLDLREQLELEMISVVRIIVYGDDHLYNKGVKEGAIHFSGVAFAAFMKQHFNVEVRDLKDGVPFCSKVSGGWLIECGATLLKHQFVLNPDQSQGQPEFLPFRESREFVVRAVWGRETRARDEIDTLLSILGHAYGTYAANRDAYDRLHILYAEIVSLIGIEGLPERLLSRISNDDLKKIRAVGIRPEDLVSGFPTWDILVAKNVIDEVYQDISSIPFEATDVMNLQEIF